MIAAALLVACGAVVALGASGRVPVLGRAWQTVSSAVSSVSSPAPEASQTGDRSGPAVDAGDAAPPVRRQATPLSSAQLGAPLVHGTFVSACGAPDDMKVVVKIAVKMGRAVNVAVTTDPPSPAVAACIDRAARDLRWDIGPKTDHVTVRY